MEEPGSREREKVRKEEKMGVGDEHRGPSPGIIIIAAAVVLVLIIGAIYLIASSGSDVESLAVGNIEKGVDGISFDIMATPSGFGEYTGDVMVEIGLEYLEGPIFSEKVHINDGWGFMEVDYTDFVWGNGEYTVTVKADGKEARNTMVFFNIVTALDIQWQGLNSDGTGETPAFQVEIDIQYMFGNNTRPLSSLPRGYDLNGIIERPEGSDITISSDEFSPSLIKLQKRVDHDSAGTYTISGTLVNTFCHPDSTFRTVTIDNNVTFDFNADPFADAGEDISIALSEGEAVVNLDASGSWDDGSIVEYRWEFGDGSTETSGAPVIQHTYTSEGTYYVELTVTDDTGKTSENQGGTASSVKITVNA